MIKAVYTLLIASLISVHQVSAQKLILDSEYEGWETNHPSSLQELTHSIWLLGNLGEKSEPIIPPTLYLLKEKVGQSTVDNTVILLGNQIGSEGLPSQDVDLSSQLSTYKQRLQLLKSLDGRLFMVPGNNDWLRGNISSREAIRELEFFTESVIDQGDVWVPSKGCADPEVIELSKDITLLFLDSQWFMDNESSFINVDGCSIDTKTELEEKLAEVFDEYDDTNILVAFHHPIKSVGPGAGYASWKDHLLPLPGIGTLGTAFNQIGMGIQNMNHPVQKEFRELLLDLTIQTGYLIFASAHDQGLQYFEETPGFSLSEIIKSDRHFIGSGAISSGGYLRKNSSLDVGYKGEGLVKLDYYENGEIWMEMWRPVDNSSNGELLFRYKLKDESYNTGEAKGILMNERDSVTTVADSFYTANRIKRKWLGNYYRTAWTTPVKMPVLDLTKKYGGLTPVKKGGGIQTTSLRLKDTIGNEYVLRSVKKDITLIVPGQARNTVIEDFAQDALAMAHPYGALAVPPLAEAAGVFHTNPQYYYVPKQPILGDFNEKVGNQMYLFEQRPEEPPKGKTEIHFGGVEEITSTKDLMREMKEEEDKFVDQQSLLTARLLDMWMGDWDRHQDQWRWAEFDSGRIEYYKPIPRDRDQVFISVDGLIPWLITREWGARMFQDFDYDVRDILGLNYNARYFDRYFLNEMDRNNWINASVKLQPKLSDEVIAQAFKRWPDTIHSLDAPEIMDKLRVRRSKLPEFSSRYYKYLAKDVDVLGTDNEELFEIKRIDDTKTQVTIYTLDKDRKIDFERYNRTFVKDETLEIRLYGFKGKDRFELTGEGRDGPLIRIIGGPGSDTIVDRTYTKGTKIKIYDTQTGNYLQLGPSARAHIKDDESVNNYDYKSFNLNSYLPLILPGFNQDDGITLGAGINFIYHGFRKHPYKSQHALRTNIAFATGSFQIGYTGDFIDVFGNWDFYLNAEGSAPRFVTNYFGLGNNTMYEDEFDEDFDFNRVRFSRLLLEPAFKYTYNKQMHTLRIGPRYEFTEVENSEDRFVNDERSGLTTEDFDAKHYAGIKVNYILDTRDNTLFPRRGYLFELDQSFNMNAEQTERSYYRLSTNVSLYHQTTLIIPMILATRVGYDMNIGDYEFFQANMLGRRQNLRGFRGERFAGDDAFYHNTELRIPVFKANNYYLPFEVGLMGFFDHGRVWLEGEDSNEWHSGYGGGLIISPYSSTAITLIYSTSDEFNNIVLKFGFLF